MSGQRVWVTIHQFVHLVLKITLYPPQIRIYLLYLLCVGGGGGLMCHQTSSQSIETKWRCRNSTVPVMPKKTYTYTYTYTPQHAQRHSQGKPGHRQTIFSNRRELLFFNSADSCQHSHLLNIANHILSVVAYPAFLRHVEKEPQLFSFALFVPPTSAFCLSLSRFAPLLRSPITHREYNNKKLQAQTQKYPNRCYTPSFLPFFVAMLAALLGRWDG